MTFCSRSWPPCFLEATPLLTSLLSDYLFFLSSSEFLNSHQFVISGKSATLFFFLTPVYLLEKLYCIWSSLNTCKGVSGSNSPRRWCVPGWKTSGESNLLAKRHLVPRMHEEWLLLGVSSHNVCENCTLCLGWPQSCFVFECQQASLPLPAFPGARVTSHHNIPSHMAPESLLNSFWGVQVKRL